MIAQKSRTPWNSLSVHCKVDATWRGNRAKSPALIERVLMNQRVWLVAACCCLLPATGANSDEPITGKKPTLWVIPHTHWEGAVFKTREEYLEVGLPNILKAMRLLREQPGYRFTLDQVAYVRPFLERYPAHGGDFRRFLAEGRLQLVGALDVMPDDNMPGGETFIRQMQYGKGYYREKLGVDVTVRLADRHVRPSRPVAAIAHEGWFQDILVRSRRAATGFPLRVFLGGDRRNPDRVDLSAA